MLPRAADNMVEALTALGEHEQRLKELITLTGAQDDPELTALKVLLKTLVANTCSLVSIVTSIIAYANSNRSPGQLKCKGLRIIIAIHMQLAFSRSEIGLILAMIKSLGLQSFLEEGLAPGDKASSQVKRTKAC